MKKLHTKSSCCQAHIWRFGNRRMQCSTCLRTWRFYPHKRGRKPKRINKLLLEKIILKNIPLKNCLSDSGLKSTTAIQKQFQRSLNVFLSHPTDYYLTDKRYILLSDGAWYKFNGTNWILYVFIIKPVNSSVSVLLDPVILRGKEGFSNWEKAINSIPIHIRNSVKAFISDNFNASDRIARQIHQLCHFHLIAQLQRRRGRRKSTLTDKSIRENIYQNIIVLLKATNPIQINHHIELLKQLVNSKQCPKKLAMMSNEFIRKINKYRNYLKYPELNLPHTNNASESLVKMIWSRTKTLKTPEAVQKWAIVYTRLKKNINCNGQF